MLAHLSMLLLWAATSGAPVGSGLEIHWSAPSQCPDADEVWTAVERLVPTHEPVALTVHATVSEIAGGYELELVLQVAGDRSARRLQTQHCEDLARATALVVATMVDPIAVVERIDALELEHETPLLPEALPSAIASKPVDPLRNRQAPETSKRVPPRARPVGSLRVEALAGVAALPRVDAGLALTAAIVIARARFELGAAHLFAQSKVHPTVADVGLRVRATLAVARMCAVPSFGRLEVPLCGGVEAGVLAARAQGDAVRDAQWVRRPYAAALAEAHAVWRATPRLGLWIGAQGLLALSRPRFTVASLDPFVQTPIGGGRVKVGVEVRFR